MRKIDLHNSISYSAFALCTFIFYLPSLWVKFALGEKNCSAVKYLCIIIYNLLFTSIHWRFVQYGQIPLFEIKDNSIIGWLSIFMLIAYAYATPTPWIKKGLPPIGPSVFNSVKNIDMKRDSAINKIKIARLHRHIYTVGSCIIIPLCAALFSLIFVATVSEFFLLTPTHRKTIQATAFIAILSAAAYAARLDYKKRDPMNIWEPPTRE